MRKKFDAIGQYMEKRMGKPFFTCDAVLDTYQNQIENLVDVQRYPNTFLEGCRKRT